MHWPTGQLDFKIFPALYTHQNSTFCNVSQTEISRSIVAVGGGGEGGRGKGEGVGSGGGGMGGFK